MRYPADAILFELLDDNGALIPTGEIVEFVGWSVCVAAIEARHAFGNLFDSSVEVWTYHFSSLRPLTAAARLVMQGVCS